MIPTKELSGEEKTSIIQSGMMFMRSITEVYGADEGMRLWDTIANTLDPQIKGHIFFAMLTGEYNNYIRINSMGPSGPANRIAVIKAIRNWTGLGLKEAKELTDELLYGKSVKIEVKPEYRAAALRDLQSVGCLV